MLPVLFWIGDTPIYAFPVCTTLGFVAGGLLLASELARKNAPPELAVWIVGTALAGGMIGARAHLALQQWDAVAADPLGFVTGRSGLVWYGGLAGGVLASAWPIRAAGVPWLRAADCAAPGLALGLAIGRIGCHLAGDGDWGTPTTLPWAVAYPDALAEWPHPADVAVHPAALYEMLGLVALCALLWRWRTRLPRDGSVFALYLLGAGVLRFGVEFVRTNPTVALGLTEAQWTSLALALGAGLALARSRVVAEEAG